MTTRIYTVGTSKNTTNKRDEYAERLADVILKEKLEDRKEYRFSIAEQEPNPIAPHPPVDQMVLSYEQVMADPAYNIKFNWTPQAIVDSEEVAVQKLTSDSEQNSYASVLKRIILAGNLDDKREYRVSILKKKSPLVDNSGVRFEMTVEYALSNPDQAQHGEIVHKNAFRATAVSGTGVNQIAEWHGRKFRISELGWIYFKE